MSATNAWLVVIAVGAVSYLFRISMLALSARTTRGKVLRPPA